MPRFARWRGASSDHVRARLRQIATPRARIQAIIDANLAPEEFDQRTGTAWLAFWGQVLQVKSLRRVQSVYQRRTLTNLQELAQASWCRPMKRKASRP